ncbi:MAG: Lrp/AsnC family transcriptional regulator [Acidimicrobiales bacterium]
MAPDNELDELDQMIVRLLMEDGRLSVPLLAEQVGIGRATAYARFDRLIERGVITGFGARVDPSALGLGVAALVLLTADQGEWIDLKERLLSTTGVQWVGLGAGSFDFMVLVRAGDLAELRDVVLRQLLNLPGIRSTQTSVLLDETRRTGAVL